MNDQDTTAEDKDTFQISLAMAGAISAGAYSGGVIDFFFEALNAWEKAKKDDPLSVPHHKVVITAIAGASAGSITGVLAAVAPRFGIPARTDAEGTRAGYTLKAMYDAWVVNVDMLDIDDRFKGLLSTGDLTGEGEVTSILNSVVLEEIGKNAFTFGSGTLTQMPFMAAKLHIYLTISNLRGVPYEVRFNGTGRMTGYGMLNHGDRAHLIVTGVGSSALESPWAKHDPGIKLDVSTLPSPGRRPVDLIGDWNTCLTAALASSAFPVGLAPRVMSVPYGDYDGRGWPFEAASGLHFAAAFPNNYQGDPAANGMYGYSCVDGGVINNEPFDYAHQASLKEGNVANFRGPATADRAVIMIDPFPELPDFNMAGDSRKRDVISVLLRLFMSLKDQARFKPSELIAALDEERYSRFLISPRREAAEKRFPGDQEVRGPVDNAIACGLLGGFGGFLHRDFRDFDYQLGRRNCQQFLRETLVLDPANDVVKSWPENVVAKDAFHPKTGNTSFRCVIPLVGDCAKDVLLLNWPRLDDTYLGRVLGALDKRVDKLFPRFRDNVPGRFARTAVGVVWNLGLKSYVLKYAEWSVKADLIRRDQSSALAPPTVAHRKVLSALANPKFDYCTATYLARLAEMTETDVVAKILRPYENNGIVVYSGKVNAWTLDAREKSLWSKIRDSISVGSPSVAR